MPENQTRSLDLWIVPQGEPFTRHGYHSLGCLVTELFTLKLIEKKGFKSSSMLKTWFPCLKLSFISTDALFFNSLCWLCWCGRLFSCLAVIFFCLLFLLDEYIISICIPLIFFSYKLLFPIKRILIYI